MNVAERDQRAQVMAHNAIRTEAALIRESQQPFWHPDTKEVSERAVDVLEDLASRVVGGCAVLQGTSYEKGWHDALQTFADKLRGVYTLNMSSAPVLLEQIRHLAGRDANITPPESEQT